MTIDAKHSIPVNGLNRSLINITGEWLFTLFLFAAYFKADPRLSFVQTHIDITLLFLGLSFLVFLYREIRNTFSLLIPWSFIWVAILFIFLAACLAGGLLHTHIVEYGLDKTMSFIFLTGWAFFGAVLIITDFLSLRRFSWDLVTITTAIAIGAILGYRGLWAGAATAFGSDHIALGRACGLGLLIIIVFLLPMESKRWVRFGLCIIAALQLWALLISISLGSIIALIISLILFFVLSARSFLHIKIERRAFKLFVLFLFAVIITASASHEIFPNLEKRTQNVLTGGDLSTNARLHLYQAAFDQWTESPIWGVGTGHFSDPVVLADIKAYPHNIILELAAETGLFGVLVFITMVGFAFSKGIIYIYTKKGLVRIMSRFLLVACCFALMNAMISYDINGNRILFTFVGLLAAIQNFQMPRAKDA